MDTIVNSALEEICAHGESGLPLSKLWQKLRPSISNQGIKLCPNVKKVIWSNLIDIPGLKFESHGVVYNSQEDNCIRSVEQSERLNLKIVAPDYMCDNFVGIYDIEASDAKLSKPERRALGCLATLRGNGIAQNELGKDFDIKGNDMFYILKKLESRGLIVRQSTIVRTRDMDGEGDLKKNPVNTNMLYLSRYAKNLGSQQRLEITKGDNSLADSEIIDGRDENSGGVAEESFKVDVHVKDFLPELEAICDKLEKTEGKVLAITDIKQELGYRMTSGHRRWRFVLNKLKEAQVVKKEKVIVDGKELECLYLLKAFSRKHFEPKSSMRGCDDLDNETAMKKAKRGHISDLLLELPIEHQIYDMVDAEGGRGLPFIEVCKRLGINNKQHYGRLFDIINRFGIYMEPELMNKAKGYRLWTPGNRNPGASTITLNEPVVDPSEISGCTPLGTDLEFQENSALTIQAVDASVPEDDSVANSETVNTGIKPKVSDGLVLDEKDESVPLFLSRSPDSTIKVSSTTSDPELQPVTAASLNVAPVEALALAVPSPSRRRSYPRYPCLTFDAANAKREQWILKLLQEEKFLVRSELYRRIQDLEKEKTTMTDRKTLDRCLNKLLQGGHCKLIVVYVPVLTNCKNSRRIQVVLHPSVSTVSAEQIHERFRSFETQIRTQSSSQLEKGEPIPQLNDLTRTHKSIKLDNQAERAEAMRANGFVLAKMVRTKLLHVYLWEYVNSLPCCDDDLSSFKNGHDLKNPHSTCKLIDLNAAIKAMPLELFLQVVGSTQKFEDMIEKCRNGFCLSDLPLLEYKRLMDILAIGRLSWLIDILRRLKLFRLVCGGHPENTENLPHTTLTHALELKPHIEEPVCSVGSSHVIHCPDLRPQIRHDFVLSSRKAVEEYWNTLEYCYSASDRKAALHAFPGCAVNEVFLFRSWASVRVMTADQRAELLKRVINDGPHRKLSFKECEEIAKDLNLTLEQVLRVYYDKRQRRLTRFERASDAGKGEIQPNQGTPALSPKKRKRSVKGKSSKHTEAGTEFGRPHQTFSQIINEEQSSFLSTSCPHTCSLEEYHARDDVVAAEESELPEDDRVGRAFLAKCALSRVKPTRRGKFHWTDDADRELVIEYARHRASLGAKFHRVDWGKLPNLPAPPDSCRRRMSALLRTSPQFCDSVMRLCNVLSQRYVHYLEKFQNKTLNDEGHQAMQCDFFKLTSDFLSQEPWDNFDDANIKLALDDALRYKKIAKSATVKDVQPFFDKCSDVNTDERHVSYGPQSVLPLSSGQYVENFPGKTEFSQRRKFDMAGKVMHALQYNSYGGGAAGLKHVEVPVPTPKKDEILLKLEATSLNPVDWKIQKGVLRPLLPPKFPFIPTTDVGGEVVEVGSSVKDFKVGDKVVAMLNTLNGGGLAEYAVAKESLTVPRPAEVSAAEGAGLPVAGVTALQALVNPAEVKLDGTGPRKNILVTAASGGVGHYAVQLAKLANTHVTATCGARNFDFVKSLGADEVLDYKTPEGAALKSPSGQKYDAVIHCTTGIPWSTFEPNLSAKGKVIDLTPGPSAMWTYAVKKLTFSKKQLVPLLLIPKKEDLDFVVSLVKEGKLKTVIDSKHPLSKAEDAWSRSIDGHATGKIIVEP